MNDTGKHIDPNQDFEKMTNDFFSRSQIPYEQSKENIWELMEEKIDKTSSPKPKRIINFRMSYAVAATILILVAVSSIFRFYTTTIECPSGQHITAQLPDGSTVRLNAQSSLSYHPYWWRFSRTVNFEGEGFFDVEKGKKFTVHSTLGSTSVLGTSFNIYSRGEKYEVACHTGKVKVVSSNKDAGILSAGYEAKLSLDGKVIVYKSKDAKHSISWIDNKFIFTAIPLGIVFEEIERQYNVNISVSEGINFTYTGYFTKDKTIEEVLELVCKPFGLTFVTKTANNFAIVRN